MCLIDLVLGTDAKNFVTSMTIANGLVKIEGETAAIAHQINGTIERLVTQDKPAKASHIICDFMSQEGSLEDITTSYYKKLRGKMMSPESWEAFKKAVRFIIVYVVKYTQIKILNKTEVEIENIKKFDDQRVIDWERVLDLISNSQETSTDKSILENFDYAIFKGLKTNEVSRYYAQGKKLKRDKNKWKKFLDLDKFKESKFNMGHYTDYQKLANENGGENPFNKPLTKGKRNSFFKGRKNARKKLPLWLRRQIPRHCKPQLVNGVWCIPGTTIKVNKDCCINYDVWNLCLLRDGCDRRQFCSLCGSQSHGAVKCEKYNFLDYIL